MPRFRLAPILTLLLLPLAPPTRAETLPEEAFSALRWRLVGPLRGGWATCAEGIPDAPDTFYFGTADGGVWKTTNAGHIWAPLFDDQPAAAIGALAIAPSDPATIYVGTGHIAPRWDVSDGNGVFRSTDAGKSWQPAGLADSRHVGRILIDPRDAKTVLVAALGHFFGPNDERGVFRTTDGGASWAKVLFHDASTGAVDLAADPTAPDVVYAALWQARRYPWQAYHTPVFGPGSGLAKSTDGGQTWTRLAGGLPTGQVGRIGLAVAPGSGGKRVWALVDAEKRGGLYRSDDAGASWQLVNPDASLGSWYMNRLTADPHDRDTVYVMGRSLRRSRDGGKTLTLVRGAPGGDDFHFMWINPEHPERQVLAADQGTIITVDGGQTWSSWYNQPTGQFYRLATDDRFPYRIYSSQQDSGTVAAASRSDYGRLTFRDWHPVGGDERDHAIPFPGNPDLVYASGLGGRVTRWDARTGQVQNVSPWQVSSYGQHPAKVRYRTTWISPLAISPVAPHAIYTAAQMLFRSNDGGTSWEEISPDLTGAVAGTTGCEGEVPLEKTRVCGFGVIFTIAPSPLEAGRIWAGTDTGLLHLTRDGGKSWNDITPAGLGEWSRINAIDASPNDAQTAYAAVDRHRLDDFAPYAFRTHDGGKSWQKITAGLPDGAFVNVVRQDPVRPGLLYAGTSRGVWVSFDDGERWQSLQLGLPTVAFNDLLVKDRDLIAATQGRGLWVLDDVSPLRQLSLRSIAEEATLLAPEPAYRLPPSQNRDTPLPQEEPTTPAAPTGAVIDYHLAAKPAGALVLEIADAAGQVVRRWQSDEKPVPLKAEQYFTDLWLGKPQMLPAQRGHNRFVWDLRGARPKAPEYSHSIAALPGVGAPLLPQGLFVPPGRYEARLTLGRRTLRQPLEVRVDPRVELEPGALETQAAFYRELAEVLGRAATAVEQIGAIAERLASLGQELPGRYGAQSALEATRKLEGELAPFLSGGMEDDLATAAGVLATLASDVEAVDRAPIAAQRGVLETYRPRIDAALARWQKLYEGPLRDLDRKVQKAELPPLLP